MPAYYTFLVVLALTPAILLFSCIREHVNWRAFGVTTLYVLLTSLIWEATLAVPRHWWGYKPSAMLGVYVNAWTREPSWPFPIEAVFVWVACPFSCILTYEYVKFRKYPREPDEADVHPPVGLSPGFALVDSHDTRPHNGKALEHGRIVAGNHQPRRRGEPQHARLRGEVRRRVERLRDGEVLSRFS